MKTHHHPIFHVLLAAACWVTSMPAAPLVFAEASAGRAVVSKSADARELDLRSLTIPPELGVVVDSWQPEDRPPEAVVIHLQDLHTHAEAQAHLSELLDHVTTRFDVRTVALEGAEGLCDVTPYTSLPDPPSTERIARLFREQGLFTGAEYYAIAHPNRVALWGIEDGALYREHLEASAAQEAAAAKVEPTVQEMRRLLQPLRASIYPETLQRFLVLRESFEAGDAQVSLTTYLTELARLAQDTKTALEAYPHVQPLMRAVQQSQTLQRREIEAERDALVHVLWTQLSQAQRAELTQAAQQATQHHAPALYYLLLIRFARAHGVWDASPSATAQVLSAPSHPAALARYVDYLTALHSTGEPSVREELANLEETLTHALLMTESQRALYRLENHVELIDRLLQARLSPSEWARYQRVRGEITAARVLEDLRRLKPDATVTTEALTRLVESLPIGERFYQLAQQRNDVFVTKTLAALAQEHAHTAVLITGGFHSPGITQRFKDHHVAYVVIAPIINGSLDQAVYEARLHNVIPSVRELSEALDRQSLVPPLASGASGPNAPHVDLRLGPPTAAAGKQPDETTSLSKRDATFLEFLILKIRALLKTSKNAADLLKAWMNDHPVLASLYGLALSIEAGKLILSAMGVDVSFGASDGSIFAMAAIPPIVPGAPIEPSSGPREPPPAPARVPSEPPAADLVARLVQRVQALEKQLALTTPGRITMAQRPEALLREIADGVAGLQAALAALQRDITHTMARELHKERRQQGLTIEQLADRSGVSPASISQIENEKFTVPSRDLQAKLARGLNVPFAQLAPQRDEQPDRDRELLLEQTLLRGRHLFGHALSITVQSYGLSLKAIKDPADQDLNLSDVTLGKSELSLAGIATTTRTVEQMTAGQSPQPIWRSVADEQLWRARRQIDEAIGGELRHRRLALHLLQDEVTRRAGLPEGILAARELGHESVRSSQMLAPLARVLETTPEDIVHAAAELLQREQQLETQIADMQQRAADTLRRLRSEQRLTINNFITRSGGDLTENQLRKWEHQ